MHVKLCAQNLFSGEFRQERDRAAAVRQKEQAKPSHLEQTAGGNDETGSSEGESL